jgi:hypothetical protein
VPVMGTNFDLMSTHGCSLVVQVRHLGLAQTCPPGFLCPAVRVALRLMSVLVVSFIPSY